jgi:hypothetical protein
MRGRFVHEQSPEAANVVTTVAVIRRMDSEVKAASKRSNTATRHI